MRIIPKTIKVPKTVLAHRLMVWERGLVEEEVKMVKKIVKDCSVGWLEGLGSLHVDSLLQASSE